MQEEFSSLLIRRVRKQTYFWNIKFNVCKYSRFECTTIKVANRRWLLQATVVVLVVVVAGCRRRGPSERAVDVAQPQLGEGGHGLVTARVAGRVHAHVPLVAPPIRVRVLHDEVRLAAPVSPPHRQDGVVQLVLWALDAVKTYRQSSRFTVTEFTRSYLLYLPTLVLYHALCVEHEALWPRIDDDDYRPVLPDRHLQSSENGVIRQSNVSRRAVIQPPRYRYCYRPRAIVLVRTFSASTLRGGTSTKPEMWVTGFTMLSRHGVTLSW